MVDVIIDAQTSGAAANTTAFKNTVWITPLVGYHFYKEDSLFYVYAKTPDGGATWSAPVVFSATTAANAVTKLAVWYDRQTDGDFGTIIHIAYFSGEVPANVIVRYRQLDTADDSLGAERQVHIGGTASSFGQSWGNGAGTGASFVDIVKARGGNLCIWFWTHNSGGAARGFRVSTDGGVTFGASADPADGDLVDRGFMVPGNETDDNDVWAFYQDVSAKEVTLKVYDRSGNSWSESAVIAAVEERFTTTWSIGACPRHSDGHTMLFLITDMGLFNADGLIFDCEDSTTFTAKTNIFTAEQKHKFTALAIDQQTDDLYAVWVGIPADTWQGDLGVYSRLSGDGGTTWGAVSARYNDAAYDQLRAVWQDISIGIGGGRIEPVWNRTSGGNVTRRRLTNFTNSIEIAGAPPPPPVPPPPIVPPGGTYGAAPGAPPGTILYITPDGIEYPLVTPHVTGRFVMSMSGFGTAPIQYISQRGPNQDGETVRDFNLTPRVIQLRERQQFKSRATWWDGRADILNDLRPNRQATATAVVTGTFRIVTANGDVRDLNVFIQDGPRFEARNVDEWDEWAFDEVLRFIAHDPLWFDPTRVDLVLAFTLDAELVFPITFPIEFGGGLIDVSTNLDYTGTWASLPTIVIVGPVDNPIIDNVTTGEKIELSSVIGPGRTVTIDLAFGQKTITDDLGNNLLGSLTTDSDLGTFHIAPTPEAPQVVGQPRPTARNVIRLRGSNPTGSTSVEVRYFTRYFGI
jgi:hypothetical protein